MAKAPQVQYCCTECGYDSPKWLGQCPACKSWGTLKEFRVSTASSDKKSVRPAGEKRVKTLRSLEADREERMPSGSGELDRVLGGGLVKGSLILVGGEPGIGKSTLLLQSAVHLQSEGKKVLYVSGEESLHQIRLRAERLKAEESDILLLSETSFEEIREVLLQKKPDVLILDSIQTMRTEGVPSAPGSVAQVRECTNLLMRLAKEEGISTFLVGHVTKDGSVAGPKTLEHMVDTVLSFEGEAGAPYRILRAVKNRFGSTNEIGVFEMTREGLREVLNPSVYLLDGRPENASGSIVSCSVEGSRPILMEVQALVTASTFAMPRRTASGFDYSRMILILAVLEKRLRLPFSTYDAYVNVTGGMKGNEPALDLAVALSLFSSLRDRILPSDLCAFGEIGLSGELRSVPFAAERLREAEKRGFRRCILPEACVKRARKEDFPSGIQLLPCKNIREAVDSIEK